MIRFCTLNANLQEKSYNEIVSEYIKNIKGKQLAYPWSSMFDTRRLRLDHAQGSDRPKSALTLVTGEHFALIYYLIRKDTQYRYQDFMNRLISFEIDYRILFVELINWNISTRWVATGQAKVKTTPKLCEDKPVRGFRPIRKTIPIIIDRVGSDENDRRLS